MALVGQLEEFHLHHIIGLLQVERQTGELMLEHEGCRVSLFFDEGAIVHAVAGKETGYDAALKPFAWERGKFHFEGYVPEIEPTITVPNAGIVSAGRRRAEEAQEVRARITTMYAVVRVVPQVDGLGGQINLTFDEWRFLTLADGRRDLWTLARLLGGDEFAVQLVANRLVKNGLIELQDPRPGMLRMLAMSTSQDLHPPRDPWTAVMDDLALDVLLKLGRGRAVQARVLVLTAEDHALEIPVEGRPDLADRLLLSEVVLARLNLRRNTLVHVRLVDNVV